MVDAHPDRIDTVLETMARGGSSHDAGAAAVTAMGEHIFHPDGAHAELRNAIMRAKSQAEWWRRCSGSTAAPG